MLPSNNRPNIGELAFLANQDRNTYFVGCFYAPFLAGLAPSYRTALRLPTRVSFASSCPATS
jgi:hypothetical protein